MSLRITIFLCAVAGIICLTVFFRQPALPETQPIPNAAPARSGIVQLGTSPLGELADIDSGLLAGNTRGEIQLFPTSPASTMIQTYKLTTNAITAPILYHQETFFVGDEGGVFWAYTLAGGVKWSFETGNRIAGGAIQSQGSIYVGSYDQVLYAFEAASGKLRFQLECEGSINGTPVLSEVQQAIFLGNCDGILRKIAIPSGELSASIDLQSPLPASPLLFAEVLYVLTHEGELLALSTTDLSIIYRVQTPDNYLSTPYAADGFLFLTTSTDAIYVHSLISGARLATIEATENMTPLQASHAGVYFAISARGKIFAYHCNGDTWQREQLANFQSDFRQSCRLSDNRLFAADITGGLFYCELSK